MATASRAALLPSLVLMISSSSNVDDDLFHIALSAFQGFTALLGLLGLVSDASVFVASLCRCAVPAATLQMLAGGAGMVGPGGVDTGLGVGVALKDLAALAPTTAAMAAAIPGVFYAGSSSSSMSPSSPTGGAGMGGSPYFALSGSSDSSSSTAIAGLSTGVWPNHLQLLGERHVACVKAVLVVARALTGVMDAAAWYPILETLQAAEGHVLSGRLGSRRESILPPVPQMNNALVGGLGAGMEVGGREFARLRVGSIVSVSSAGFTGHGSAGGNSGGGGAAALENQYLGLVSIIKRFFEDTVSMDMKSLLYLTDALCRLVQDTTISAGPMPSISSSLVSSMMRPDVSNNSGSSTSSSTSTASISVSTSLTSSSNKPLDEKSSFAICRLLDLASANRARLVTGPTFEVWRRIVGKLTDVAHAPTGSCSAAIRAQACSVFGEVLEIGVRSADLKASITVEGLDTPILVEHEVLAPLKRFMLLDSVGVVPAGAPAIDSGSANAVVRGPWFVEVQKYGLDTLKKIIESNGRGLSRGWHLIFEIVRCAVVGGGGAAAAASSFQAKAKLKTASSSTPVANGFVGGVLSIPVTEGGMLSGITIPVDGNSGKAAVHVKAAFAVLEQICDNLLERLTPLVLLECIETLGCFGSQPDDVNISLTAIRHLWSVSDNVLNQRRQLSQKIESDELKLEKEKIRKSLSGRARTEAAVKEIILVLDNIPSVEAMDALWMHILAHLSQLCSDSRPDVRISANQTLFRTIYANGKRLTLESWDECIWNVLFPLLERVKISSERVELIGRLNDATSPSANTKPTEQRMSNMSSRSTVSKQWDETKINTLTGVTTSFINFFPDLLELGDDFDRAWGLFHDYIRTWCLEGSTEVSTSAVKSLRLLVRYPKEQGATEQGAIPPEMQGRLKCLWRVSWDTWESIGLGIISCADEHSGDASSIREISRAPSSENVKPGIVGPVNQLLHGPFSQETLTILVNVFQDIYEAIRDSFGLHELKRMLVVLSSLVLYHTNPTPGALPSKLRADNISDLDSMTHLQDAVMGLSTGTTVDFDHIRGAPEAIMWTVSGFIRLPFVRMKGLTKSAQVLSRSQPQTGGMEKGFTYMALAKRSLQHLVTLFLKYGRLSTVYSGGTFETVLSALDIPMRARYDCPSAGVKDSTPLWRCAANTAVTLVEMGLKHLDAFVTEMPHEILNSIYYKILDLFDGFLLPASSPPSSLSPEEIDVDIDFDISVFETFQTDVMRHIGLPHAPDDLIVGMVKIITRCTKLYVTHVEAVSMNTVDDVSQRLSTSSPPLRVSEVQSSSPLQQQQQQLLQPQSQLSSLRDSISGSSPPTQTSKEHSFRYGTTQSGTPSNRNSLGAPPSSTLLIMESARVLGVDVVPLGREKFSKRCLECLLTLCEEQKNVSNEGGDGLNNVDPNMGSMHRRVAALAAPLFLDKVKTVLKNYCNDFPLYGKLPLPRIRNEEIVLILKKIRDIDLYPGILEPMIVEDKIHPLRSHILSGRSAHLFVCYSELCDLLTVVAKSGQVSGDMALDGAQVVDLVRDCLRRVGTELGIIT